MLVIRQILVESKGEISFLLVYGSSKRSVRNIVLFLCSSSSGLSSRTSEGASGRDAEIDAPKVQTGEK